MASHTVRAWLRRVIDGPDLEDHRPLSINRPCCPV
jgi:hypothetical protein